MNEVYTRRSLRNERSFRTSTIVKTSACGKHSNIDWRTLSALSAVTSQSWTTATFMTSRSLRVDSSAWSLATSHIASGSDTNCRYEHGSPLRLDRCSLDSTVRWRTCGSFCKQKNALPLRIPFVRTMLRSAPSLPITAAYNQADSSRDELSAFVGGKRTSGGFGTCSRSPSLLLAPRMHLLGDATVDRFMLAL